MNTGIIVLLAGVAVSGCSGGCYDQDLEIPITSVEYQAWKASGSCTGKTDGLKASFDQCPSADAAREYLNKCSLTDARKDSAWFVRYDPNDRCVYDVHQRTCIR